MNTVFLKSIFLGKSGFRKLPDDGKNPANIGHGATRTRAVEGRDAGRVKHLKAHFIETPEPNGNRVLPGFRDALEAADGELKKIVDTLVKPKLPDAALSGAKVTEALKPITDKHPLKKRLAENLCGACLVRTLRGLPPEKFAFLVDNVAQLVTVPKTPCSANSNLW